MIKEMVDIILRNKYGGFVAVVEIRNRKNLTRDIAIEFYNQMSDYVRLTKTSYYLLISQDVCFLWKNLYLGNTDNQPVAELPMGEVIKRYSPETNLKEERLETVQLQYLIYGWLSDLAWGRYEPLAESERTLASNGFLQEIQNADVQFDV